jgi:methylphosphonate synthase
MEGRNTGGTGIGAGDAEFGRRAAALLRAAANDLKRDEASADGDLGLAAGTFADLVSGRRPITWDLLTRAAQVWPLNERDLLPIHDDCPDGARIFRYKDSLASSRVLSRAGTDYYEYRDTAMSRVASYRPEWIRMLQVVDDNDPANPLVRWNRGHLLYQFTYFVGPVNYYYQWGDQRYCVPMETGDSVWGLPFAPHSFTARSADEPAYILALTYGGDLVGDAQRELAVAGARIAERLALPSGPAGTTELLRSFIAARALTRSETAQRSGIPTDRVAAVLDGAEPEPAELAAFADALGVSVRDLLAPRTTTRDGVHLRRRAGAVPWHYPDEGEPAYLLRELAGDPLHPHTSALEVEVATGAPGPGGRLVTAQHQYLYVLGTDAVRVDREGAEEPGGDVLHPGDSMYIRPLTAATFSAVDGGRPRLLLLRIGGTVTTDVRFALRSIAAGGIERYVREEMLWYAREGDAK